MRHSTTNKILLGFQKLTHNLSFKIKKLICEEVFNFKIVDFLQSPKSVLETSKLEKILIYSSVELLKILSHESFAESVEFYSQPIFS